MKKRADKLIKFFCPGLLLLCPLIYSFLITDYPLFSIESSYLMCLWFLISCFAGWRMISGSWSAKVIILVLAFMICISFFPEFQRSLIYTSAVLLFLAIVIVLGDKASWVLCPMALSFLLGLFLFSIGEVQTGAIEKKQMALVADNSLPPVVHLILDEHIGVDGLPIDFAKGKALQQALKKLYLDNGFRLFEKAYSRYSRSYNSIPNALNFNAIAQDNYYFPTGKKELTHNEYFQTLSTRGYGIKVYQSSYMDFCHGEGINYLSCYTYPGNNVADVAALEIPSAEKFKFLVKHLLLSSSLYQRLML